jgi:hypothetical protein
VRLKRASDLGGLGFMTHLTAVGGRRGPSEAVTTRALERASCSRPARWVVDDGVDLIDNILRREGEVSTGADPGLAGTVLPLHSSGGGP